MRKLSYPVVALLALLVPSSALAETYQVGPDKPRVLLEESSAGGGEGTGDADGDPSTEEDGGNELEGGSMGASDGGGCSTSGIPPAGRNAALALLGLAFMSFGIRLAPRRRRVRVRRTRVSRR